MGPHDERPMQSCIAGFVGGVLKTKNRSGRTVIERGNVHARDPATRRHHCGRRPCRPDAGLRAPARPLLGAGARAGHRPRFTAQAAAFRRPRPVHPHARGAAPPRIARRRRRGRGQRRYRAAATMGAATSTTWRPFRGHPVLPRQDRHRALALAPARPVQREPAQHHGPYRIGACGARYGAGRGDPSRGARGGPDAVGRQRLRAGWRPGDARAMAGGLRRRSQPGAQGRWLRVRRHRAGVHRLFRGRGPGR